MKTYATILVLFLSTILATNNEVRANNEPDNAVRLLKQHCFSCHNPNPEAANRLAPPLYKVKDHYYSEGMSRNEFISSIVKFVRRPSEKKSKMMGAIKTFGLMPYLKINDKILQQIAAYIYDTDIISDEWDTVWQNRDRTSALSEEAFERQALTISTKAQAALAGVLKNALSAHGTEYALEFCNTNAISITDSMGVKTSAKIRRVSDRPRNQNNMASTTEATYIQSLRRTMSQGNEEGPLVTLINGKQVAYFNIKTNALCLQCHGNPSTDIPQPVLQKIKHLYPSDKATGYGVDQVRGLWVVEIE